LVGEDVEVFCPDAKGSQDNSATTNTARFRE
jgi:hypothetical protein